MSWFVVSLDWDCFTRPLPFPAFFCALCHLYGKLFQSPSFPFRGGVARDPRAIDQRRTHPIPLRIFGKILYEEDEKARGWWAPGWKGLTDCQVGGFWGLSWLGPAPCPRSKRGGGKWPGRFPSWTYRRIVRHRRSTGRCQQSLRRGRLGHLSRRCSPARLLR